MLRESEETPENHALIVIRGFFYRFDGWYQDGGMTMNIERKLIQAGRLNIPCVILTPPASHGTAVIVHGYGGCKEEQLALAWRVAEIGITACAIDHRGHGEHKLPLDEDVLQDVETAIKYCRGFGKVAAIGHSSGGRLSLISSADFAIGISPALSTAYSAETQRIIKDLRSYRVRESFSNVNFETLKKLPVWQSSDNKPTLIVFGSRDVLEIVSSCKELKTRGNHVIEIDQALHNDIFLLEETFAQVVKKLGEWFKNERV
jgi:pimeloyl-ACP methyl ester carboxylesterase